MIAGTFAAVLLAWLLPSLWFRLHRLALLDCFLLAVAAFFGAYTVIDVLTIDARVDGLMTVAAFTVVLSCTFVIWLVARRSPFPETTLSRLRIDWAACPQSLVIALVGLSVLYGWYTADFFGQYRMLGKSDLADLDRRLPYWHTSLGMVATASIYPAALCAWGKIKDARGIHRIFWMSITAVSALMVLGMGRRAFLSLAVICAWDLLTRKRIRAVFLIVLALPALVMVSNLFQTYRAITVRGIPLNNVIAETDFSSLTKLRELANQAADVRRTTANLEVRMAMWRYNTEIMEAHWEGRGRLQWGRIGLAAIPLYIPSAIYSKKGVEDTETVLLTAFRLPKYDRPENIFVTTYADFGFLCLIVAPALILLFVSLCAFALRRMSDPFLRMLLMGMALFYALNMEIGFLYPLAMTRSFLLIAAIYICSRYVIRLARSIVVAAKPT